MQNEDKIISASVDTFLEKAKYTLTVPLLEPITHYREQEPIYKEQSVWDKLLRKPKEVIPHDPEIDWIETERSFTIYPCKAANMARIARAALTMPTEIQGDTKAEAYLPLIDTCMDTVLYVVAAGIQNNQHEPDPELIQFLRNNCDAIDLLHAAYYVMENVNMESFSNTTVLIRGAISIIKKTGPIDRSE
jgi:hypothetical protein